MTAGRTVKSAAGENFFHVALGNVVNTALCKVLNLMRDNEPVDNGLSCKWQLLVRDNSQGDIYPWQTTHMMEDAGERQLTRWQVMVRGNSQGDRWW